MPGPGFGYVMENMDSCLVGCEGVKILPIFLHCSP